MAAVISNLSLAQETSDEKKSNQFSSITVKKSAVTTSSGKGKDITDEFSKAASGINQ